MTINTRIQSQLLNESIQNWNYYHNVFDLCGKIIIFQLSAKSVVSDYYYFYYNNDF